MMSLPKNNGKCGRPINQSNYISLEKYRGELLKNVRLIKFEINQI